MSFCTSCCGNCHHSGRASRTKPDLTSPYTLRNLLALGTLLLPVHVSVDHQICKHAHAADTWHPFDDELVLPHLFDPEAIHLCTGLGFLAKEQFLKATYHSNPEGWMEVRIYLIPYDLPKVNGQLRLRKQQILSEARDYLRALLPRVSQDVGRWNGNRPTGNDQQILPLNNDSRTLSDIFSDLPSPSPDPVPGYGEICSRLLDEKDTLDGLGMRSTLHIYQRHSVAAMLQKELDLNNIPNPLFLSLLTIDGRPFFLQPGTLEILQEQPMISPYRGGMLCEELGTGKTVMMLALIVATLRQISSPEPSLVDARPVMTPMAYAYFPDPDFTDAREKARVPPLATRSVPSLVDLMLHRARTDPLCDIPRTTIGDRYSRIMEKEESFNAMHPNFAAVVHDNVPFYHHYLGEPDPLERSRRSKQPTTPRVMYLTSATLLVVPPNLVSQWDREIHKHCEVQLRVLILRNKSPMPDSRALATDYDIVLISTSRFSMEYNKNNKILDLHQCKCPLILGPKIFKRCTCRASRVSPLLQVRWKRLSLDEGHVAATRSTNLVPMSRLLSVERKWVMTGTPTPNMLGLSLGMSGVITGKLPADTIFDEDPSGDSDVEMIDSENVVVSNAPPADTLMLDASASSTPQAPKNRIWNRTDKGDLNKFGNILVHFFALPQFRSNPRLMATHVIDALTDPHAKGPHMGAIQVLSQVMSSIMIRHLVKDVEEEVQLPPLSQEAVLLDLDPWAVKSFNVLQAIIAINAIDSERQDADYMFHPSNAAHLQEAVKNMSQALFWNINTELEVLRQTERSAQEFLTRLAERGAPSEDVETFKEAIKHIRLALNDPVWLSIQTHEDVPYRVYDMSPEVFDSWSRFSRKDTAGSDSDPRFVGLLHADMLIRLYRQVVQRPLLTSATLAAFGKAELRDDREYRRRYEESLQRKSKGGQKKKQGEEPEAGVFMVDKFATKAATAAETLEGLQKEYEAKLEKLGAEVAEGAGSIPDLDLSHLQQQPSKLIASTPQAKIRVGSSVSSKLNYIINEVTKYSPTEKFLIFSESALSLAHVAEALDLIHVKFLQFTTQVPISRREQLVLTFETSDVYRVFLMELKHGARGLNLVSASRIIFCEPVWQPDVESQAIKRAHRIGQTRPITVKTLAIRQTAEENMVARRSALKDTHEKLPKVLEEAGMRHYIANPKFITHTSDLVSVPEFPLFDLPAEFLQPRSGVFKLKIPPRIAPNTTPKRVRIEEPIIDRGHQPPLKKKKFRRPNGLDDIPPNYGGEVIYSKPRQRPQ